MLWSKNELYVNKLSITSYMWNIEQDAKLSELQISYSWTGNNNTYFRGLLYGVRCYIKVATYAWCIVCAHYIIVI